MLLSNEQIQKRSKIILLYHGHSKLLFNVYITNYVNYKMLRSDFGHVLIIIVPVWRETMWTRNIAPKYLSLLRCQLVNGYQ